MVQLYGLFVPNWRDTVNTISFSELVTEAQGGNKKLFLIPFHSAEPFAACGHTF